MIENEKMLPKKKRENIKVDKSKRIGKKSLNGDQKTIQSRQKLQKVPNSS